MNRFIILFLFSLGILSTYVFAVEVIPLNEGWNFHRGFQAPASEIVKVTLPHTWNAGDGMFGNADYYRGLCNYSRKLSVPAHYRGKRFFLKVMAAQTVADIFIDHHFVMQHKGGYTAFVAELTDFLVPGTESVLEIRVSNAQTMDVAPICGDFNMFGGLYRGVELLVTEDVCIEPAYYASSGVFFTQSDVSEKKAHLKIEALLSARETTVTGCEVEFRLYDKEKLLCRVASAEVGEDKKVMMDIVLERPHLWDGVKNPYLYKGVVILRKDGKEIDKVEQPLGLRYYTTDADRGFFLNGKHLPLHGVCRHQEWAEVGNALRPMHHEEDTRLMLEMGVNAIRLAHYPQATYMYDLMDKHGIVTWAEIPFVGPGGYADKGFVDQPSFRENGKEQLKEMIRQHYNHPSICFWGLFNELKEQGDNPVEYIKELNAIAHQEDPTRPTTSASNQEGALNFITDHIAWNRYDGWYGATPATLATWLDATHKNHPEIKIAISEYGAGASIYHQQDSLVQTVPGSWWHPENWQTEYHIQNWKIINERPYVWASFVWNMFDFGAAHRTEGDRPGINDKGLVTHDRKIKKDAYYFYRANWNPEPMIYIAGRRNVNRVKPLVDVQVFSNVEEVILIVNDCQCGKMKPDSLKVCLFKDVPLRKGRNEIEVRANDSKKQLIDRCTWILQ